MRIIKIGTFDKNGMPTGWELDLNNGVKGQYCVGLDELYDGSVDVNGIEIVEWTNERKRAVAKASGMIQEVT